jgi:hypothetical protein
MATRSLSPKQIVERMQRYRQAVMVLARQSARKAIKGQIRALGDKLFQVPARTINIFAEAYFDVHRERLIAEAEHTVNTSPYFEKWRLPDCAQLRTFVQRKNF